MAFQDKTRNLKNLVASSLA